MNAREPLWRQLAIDDCNVFISALELSTFYLIYFPTFLFAYNPQRFVRLHFVWEYVPNFFPLGFLWFSYQAEHTASLSLPVSDFVQNCLYVFLNYY